jgi:hypothetical protein
VSWAIGHLLRSGTNGQDADPKGRLKFIHSTPDNSCHRTQLEGRSIYRTVLRSHLAVGQISIFNPSVFDFRVSLRSERPSVEAVQRLSRRSIKASSAPNRSLPYPMTVIITRDVCEGHGIVFGIAKPCAKD